MVLLQRPSTVVLAKQQGFICPCWVVGLRAGLVLLLFLPKVRLSGPCGRRGASAAANFDRSLGLLAVAGTRLSTDAGVLRPGELLAASAPAAANIGLKVTAAAGDPADLLPGLVYSLLSWLVVTGLPVCRTVPTLLLLVPIGGIVTMPSPAAAAAASLATIAILWFPTGLESQDLDKPELHTAGAGYS